MAETLSEPVEARVSLVRPMVRSDFGELKGMDVEEGPEEAGVEKTPEEIFFEGVSDETFEELFGGDKNCVEGGLSQGVAAEETEEWEICPPCGEEEGRIAVGLRSPIKVSEKERDDHNRTHAPNRSWCSVCVKARGQTMSHLQRRAADGEEGARIPRISMDYFFMSKQDEDAKENPILVVLNEDTNEKYARATGRKGVGTEGVMEWLVKDVHEELKSWGHAGGTGGHIILKSDSEKAMASFRNALAKFHGGIVVPEAPAKGESQSNGAVEGAWRLVKEFIRVFKIQMEEQTGI